MLHQFEVRVIVDLYHLVTLYVKEILSWLTNISLIMYVLNVCVILARNGIVCILS
jgi:hypothetical protein